MEKIENLQKIIVSLDIFARKFDFKLVRKFTVKKALMIVIGHSYSQIIITVFNAYNIFIISRVNFFLITAVVIIFYDFYSFD